MEFNRNQWFMIGLVVLAIGIQLRLVDSYVLNEESSRFIEERMNKSQNPNQFRMPVLSTAMPVARKKIEPPKWVGWAVLSAGIILSLHALAMPKPGG